MTSLNDIPLVGNVVHRIEDAAIDSATLRLRYLLCYKSLVKVLKIEVGKLIIEEEAMSRKVGEERDNGKVIKDHVVKWQQDVEDIKNVVESLLERYESRPSWMCFKDIPFAKPVSRFRLGKQASEGAKTVTELTNLGEKYRATSNEIAHHPPKENLPTSDTTYQIFPSRQEAYGKLWEALVKEDGHPILGIYGMPGVGKTRTMEEAWKQAKEKGFFSKVTRAVVGSETIDVIKLQHQLAGYLDCHLKSNNNEEDRASQLERSLMNGGKTLVIFDDVWDAIPLNKIGIPFGDGKSKGCKILFTTRKQSVCLVNDCKDPIQIEILTEDESWHMFKEAVGTYKVESLQDSLLAVKVCKKCGRLPLLINAVGNALKFMTENSWKNALSELDNCRYEEIDGMEPGVYGCIKLSYDKLTEAGKTCLLLCSLFPEDADISIKELSNLATGSQLLDLQKNIAGVVDILKSSSLLLQGKDDVKVKLHDIIRDVAKNIAATDPKYAFLSIRSSLGWPNNSDHRTLRLLNLEMELRTVPFANDLVCPDLHTLLLQCNYKQLVMYERMDDFRFLLQGMNFPKQHLSIHSQNKYMSSNRPEKLISIQGLGKLGMIMIDGYDIAETFFSSVPQTLHTFCTEDCALPIPLDLSNLKNLRKLELQDGREIRMAPKSISSLSRLEELIIPSGFSIWEDADATSIYVELNNLTRLRNLNIRLPYSRSCLNRHIMSNLLEFKISVGCQNYDLGRSLYEKSIVLEGNHRESEWMVLVERAEEVNFDGVEGLFNNSKHTEASANLKRLTIARCNNMDHLVRSPLDGRNQLLAHFSNLCFLKIYYCQGLKYLFSASAAKCLLKLQVLNVSFCDAIEEIVKVEYDPTDHGDVIISFPKLKELHLRNLHSLKSFSAQTKVTFQSLEKLVIWDLEDVSEIWGKGIYHQEDSSSFSQLKVLEVVRCDKLVNVIPVTSDHEFNNLEKVNISSCQRLRTVFQGSSIATDIGNFNQNDGRRIVFSSLKHLHLDTLPNIEVFWSFDGETLKLNPSRPKFSFPNLEVFEMWGCGGSGWVEQIEVAIDDDSPSKLSKLQLQLINSKEVQLFPSEWRLQLQMLSLNKFKWHGHSLFSSTTLTPNRLQHLTISRCEIIGFTLFKSSYFRSFQQLETLEVQYCDSLEEIVEEDLGMDDEKNISFPCLRSVKFFGLPKLKSFSQSSTYAFNMPALTSISLGRCPLMDKFTFLPIHAPLLRTSGTRGRRRNLIPDLNTYVREEVYGKLR